MGIMQECRIFNRLSIKPDDRVSIFVNKREDLAKVDAIVKEASGNSNAKFRITGFDFELPSYFNDLGAEIDYSWDYLNEGDCAYIDDFFFRGLTGSWFDFKVSPQG